MQQAGMIPLPPHQAAEAGMLPTPEMAPRQQAPALPTLQPPPFDPYQSAA
jgi:hypothetical protein